MKRLLCILIIGLFCISGGISVWAAQSKVSYIGEQTGTKKQDKKQKVNPKQCGQFGRPIRVATFETNPPFGWVDFVAGSFGVPDRYYSNGFALGVFRQMAEARNLSVQPVGFSSYQDALRALSRGNVDVFAGAYYDPNIGRMGNGFVMPSFFQNAIVAVFMKGKERPVNKFEDLIGMKGVVRLDEHFYELMYHGLPGELTIKQVPDAREAFTLLMNGEVDYMLSSPYAAEAEARRFKVDQEIELSETALFGPELFFVFSLSSDCRGLRSHFANWIRETKSDPTIWKRLLVSYIDDWGKRFKDSPGLKEQLQTGTKEIENGSGAVSVNNADIPDVVVADGAIAEEVPSP